MKHFLPLRKPLASLALSLSLLGGASPSFASAASFMPCFKEAAQKYQLNEYLLKAIALHESGMNPRANNTANFDDSEDIGIMQINSWWLSNSLKKYGITRSRLWDPCLNIHTGAWILAQEVQKHGRGWEAIGYYNARTDWKRARYIGLIKASLSRVYTTYGIASYNALDPTAPISAPPTKAASFQQQHKWGELRPAKQRRSTKAAPNGSRRIIVVSAETRNDDNG